MSLDFKKIQEKSFVDIPSSEPAVRMVIPRVGISNRPAIFKLKNPLTQVVTAMNTKLKAGAELAAGQRGIHMSRIEECIDELREAGLSPSEFALQLSKLVQKSQEQKESFIKLECDVENSVNKNKSGKPSIELIKFHSTATATEDSDKLEIGVSVPFMNACPCTQRWAMRDFFTLLREKGMDEAQAKDLTLSAPLQAHTNGGMASLYTDSKTITHADLYKVLDQSVPILREMLKGIDEHAFVTQTHKQGQFCEDNIRTIAKKTVEVLGPKMEDSNLIRIKVEVNESVHFHNLFAELEQTFGMLKAGIA